MLLSGAEAGFCLFALADERRKQCQLAAGVAQQVGIEYWLYVQFGGALLSLIFAPYIHARLWQTIQQDAASEAQLLAAEVPEMGDSDSSGHEYAFSGVPGQMVKEAFWNIVWHDLGVLLYFFTLVGFGYWSHMGSSWLSALSEEAPMCDPEGYVSHAAQLGVVFVAFVVFYFLCFSCYLSCISSSDCTSITIGEKALRGSRGAEYTMGAQPCESSSRTPSQRMQAPGMTMKLLACLCLDLMGDATYLMPGLDEEVDVAYAPAMAIALKMMFRYHALAGFGFTEEILPFTDAIPTATLGWFLDVGAPDNCFTRAIGIRSDENL